MDSPDDNTSHKRKREPSQRKKDEMEANVVNSGALPDPSIYSTVPQSSASNSQGKYANKLGLPVRLRPPPIQKQDLFSVPKPPTFHKLQTNKHFSNNDLDTPQSRPSTPTDSINFINGQSHESLELSDLYLTDDHPMNKRGFRYNSCCVNESLSSVLYTNAEIEPYHARTSYEDRSVNIMISKDGLTVGTDKGFRSARANVAVREGDWYFEVRIIKANDNSDSHVRVGWMRREASVEAPVGSDAYGYGLRDVEGQKVHCARPTDFMRECAQSEKEADKETTEGGNFIGFKTGDVLGLRISLPQKIDHSNIVTFRDRIPIRYKGQLYFESLDYMPTKPMDQLRLPKKMGSSTFKTSEKAKDFVPEVIPNSFIEVFKNGKRVGIPFKDLYAFLPPNSQYLPQYGVEKVAVDDGHLGYYPAISCYKGGMARFNFGPNFEFVPEELREALQAKDIRPISERYNDQIAEDITLDILDQVEYEILDAKELIEERNNKKPIVQDLQTLRDTSSTPKPTFPHGTDLDSTNEPANLSTIEPAIPSIENIIFSPDNIARDQIPTDETFRSAELTENDVLLIKPILPDEIHPVSNNATADENRESHTDTYVAKRLSVIDVLNQDTDSVMTDM